MKTMKRILSVALLVLVLGLLTLSAFAAGSEGYTYTVRVYPGNNGEGEYNATGLTLSDRINVNVIDGKTLVVNGTECITLSNDKYYIKGVRISGQDVSDTRQSFAVEGDIDLVVAYGMMNGAVQYTVNYVDMDGNPMEGTPGSITGYGAVGEVIVVGYYPVDGYLPYAYSADGILVQTYNLTNSNGLSENAGDNVFTFIYQAIPAEAAPEATAAPGAANANADQNANAPGDANAPGGPEGEAPGDENAPGAEGNEGEDIGDNAVPQAAPEEILDVDTPLGAPTQNGDAIADGRDAVQTKKAAIIGAGAAVIVIGGGTWLGLRGRKKSKSNGN